MRHVIIWTLVIMLAIWLSLAALYIAIIVGIGWIIGAFLSGWREGMRR